jgi:sulfide:quinone oxidoreductase
VRDRAEVIYLTNEHERDGTDITDTMFAPSGPSTRTTPRSRSRRGRPTTGRAPTRTRATRTCSVSASRSRRRTPSPARIRHRAAHRSRPHRPAPACHRGSRDAPSPAPSPIASGATTRQLRPTPRRWPAWARRASRRSAQGSARRGGHDHDVADRARPDRYPGTGRDPAATFGEVGLAGHWMKRLLHTLFIYKAKARPGWWLVPQ